MNQPDIQNTHSIILKGRNNLTITGISDIDSFDEETVSVYTDQGELIVRGTGLHIDKIDVDAGLLSVAGLINSLEYTDNPSGKTSLWAKLFR